PLTPAFLLKLDPTAENTIWVSHSDQHTQSYGSLMRNGNELAMSFQGGGPDFTWGDQVRYINESGHSYEVLLALFDTETGACTLLDHITGYDNSPESGTAIVADANGDYILGGWMELQLTDSFG